VDVDNDAWFEAEGVDRGAMIEELRRIRRRTKVRPLPVLLLGGAITALLVYKIATRTPQYEAEVVLALTQGSMAGKSHDLPVDELRQFVDGVLLPDGKVRELIERRDLFPLRKKLGMEYALESFHEQLDVQVWKNTFLNADSNDRSARIGLSYVDKDPDRAYEIARDLAAIVIETQQEHLGQLTKQLVAEIDALRTSLSQRVADLARSQAEKLAAQAKAAADHHDDVAAGLGLEVAELAAEQRSAQKRLDQIAVSRDSLADRIAAAGLDLSIDVVEENRPERPPNRTFLLALIGVVIGVCSLLGAALVVGAFDARVHDTEDVTRLGLPVLGHVPGFAGDGVGSLQARGAARRRVPSFSRWRSHR